MSGELEKREDKPLSMREFCETADMTNPANLASVFMSSGLFQGTQSLSQAMVKILAGKEVGVGAFASMTAIHIVKGRTMLGYHILGAKIKDSGRYDYRVKSCTAELCEIDFLGADGEKIGESSFTIEEARQAGLLRGGGNWTSYPKVMLFARALSQGQRMHCPDVTHGMPVYTEGDFADGEFGRVSRPPREPTRTDALNAALEGEPEAPPAEPKEVEAEVIDSGQDIPGLT